MEKWQLADYSGLVTASTMLLQSANDASVETDMFVLMEGEALHS
jgi:hypothetical protein